MGLVLEQNLSLWNRQSLVVYCTFKRIHSKEHLMSIMQIVFHNWLIQIESYQIMEMVDKDVEGIDPVRAVLPHAKYFYKWFLVTPVCRNIVWSIIFPQPMNINSLWVCTYYTMYVAKQIQPSTLLQLTNWYLEFNIIKGIFDHRNAIEDSTERVFLFTTLDHIPYKPLG